MHPINICKPCTSMSTGLLTVESIWTNWLDSDDPLIDFHGSSHWCGLKVSDLDLINSCLTPQLGKRGWESCFEHEKKKISFQSKQPIMGQDHFVVSFTNQAVKSKHINAIIEQILNGATTKTFFPGKWTTTTRT